MYLFIHVFILFTYLHKSALHITYLTVRVTVLCRHRTQVFGRALVICRPKIVSVPMKCKRLFAGNDRPACKAKRAKCV